MLGVGADDDEDEYSEDPDGGGESDDNVGRSQSEIEAPLIQ